MQLAVIAGAIFLGPRASQSRLGPIGPLEKGLQVSVGSLITSINGINTVRMDISEVVALIHKLIESVRQNTHHFTTATEVGNKRKRGHSNSTSTGAGATHSTYSSPYKHTPASLSEDQAREQERRASEASGKLVSD